MEKSDIQYVDEKSDSVYAPKQHQVVQIDNVPVLGLDPADAEFYMNFSDERRKKVIHKVRLSFLFSKTIDIIVSTITADTNRLMFVSCPCWPSSISSRTSTEPTLE
jgi:hypothetical protein